METYLKLGSFTPSFSLKMITASPAFSLTGTPYPPHREPQMFWKGILLLIS